MDRLTQQINDTFTACRLSPEQRNSLLLLIALVVQAVRAESMEERRAA